MRFPAIIASSILFLTCSSAFAQQIQPIQEGAFPVRLNQMSLAPDGVLLSFHLPDPAVVSLTFREISGNITLTRHLGELPGGQYQRSFGLNGLPPGSYLVILRAGYSTLETPLYLCAE